MCVHAESKGRIAVLVGETDLKLNLPIQGQSAERAHHASSWETTRRAENTGCRLRRRPAHRGKCVSETDAATVRTWTKISFPRPYSPCPLPIVSIPTFRIT